MEGQRIDKALAVLQPDMSRSYIQKMIKDGKVFVNQKVIKANYKLESTDEITVHVPEPVKLDIQPENMDLDILYEDEK